MQAYDLDDELAILSLQAAEELDRRLEGKKSSSDVLKQLGLQLKSASGLGRSEAKAFLHSDPSTTEIFAQAVRAASTEQVSDIDHLSKAMQRIISPLVDNEKSLSKRELAMVKTFCLPFHRSMMAHKSPRRYEQDRFKDDSGTI